MAKRFTLEQATAAFWAKVDRRDHDECWPWRRSLNHRGYGRWTNAAKYFPGMKPTSKAHRIAYWLTHGELPDLFLLHSCDFRRCCNPAHLTPGTHQENMFDMCAKGRSRSKLVPEVVLEYRRQRAAGETRAALARKLGVSRSALRDIDTGRTWRFVA